MPFDHSDNYEIDFDPKVLNRFIFLFNIARHHVKSYPSDHPQIAKSVQNFLVLLDNLLECRDDIPIGVAKSSLIIGDASLEKNAVFKDLAGSLFDCDIASFTIHRSVTHHELLEFYNLLSMEPDEIRQKGGFKFLLKEAGVQALKVMDIDYSSFQSTEMDVIAAPTKDEKDPVVDMHWENFISSLIEGRLEQDGESETEQFDPATIARLINEEKKRKGEAEEQSGEESYDATITSFFKELDKEGLDQKSKAAMMVRLGRLADQLDPNLRRELLNSTFATLGDQTELAENMLTGLSPATLLEIFGEANEEKLSIPPTLLNLLAKLTETTPEGADSSRVIKQHEERIDSEIEHRIRTIFEGSTPGQFMPQIYQDFLEDVLSLDKFDDIDQATTEEVAQSLEGHDIETSVMNVILDLIDEDPMSDQAELMTQNLIDLVRYFIEVGDFASLVTTYDRLQQHHEDAEAFSIPIAEQTLEVYDTEEFTNSVLEGFDIWGAEKHDDIRKLIGHIKTPFIEPMINRLADEGDMTMRQFLMSVLYEIGPAAKEALLKHLHDKRWYFVRNIIILLRRYNDPSIMLPMRRLIGHKHPKVHLEAMKTYLHFNDPKADQYLVREMQCDDMQRRKNAALLARNSKGPAVHQELINIITTGRSDPEYELRAIALKSLAEIGDPNFIPSFEPVLASRNLLRSGLHKQFKANILRSLVKYPPAAVHPFLKRLVAQSKGDFVDIASQVLRRLPKGGTP